MTHQIPVHLRNRTSVSSVVGLGFDPSPATLAMVDFET